MTNVSDILHTDNTPGEEDSEFAPSIPDGKNQSLNNKLSETGEPEIGKVYRLPRRSGVAVLIKKGRRISIVNTTGKQVCDLWCFYANNLNEYLSMEHSRTHLGKVFFGEGDELVSNQRRPLMKLVQDSSLGVHDTFIAACDTNRYKQLGVSGYHDNCRDNLRLSMSCLNLKIPCVPSPFNIWMNVTLESNGEFRFKPPISKAGDYVTFEVEDDVYVVMSACPQDKTPVNGAEQKTEDLHFFVE